MFQHFTKKLQQLDQCTFTKAFFFAKAHNTHLSLKIIIKLRGKQTHVTQIYFHERLLYLLYLH